MAVKYPINAHSCLNKAFQSPKAMDVAVKVISLAYHLADFRGERPFFLPIQRIAEWLSKDLMCISRVITILNGLYIKCVKTKYSHKKGIAKEYIFIGHHLLEKPSVTEKGECA